MKTKNNTIILDSNVLIALFNENDSLHAQAAQLMQSIEKRTKIISDLILAEIGSVLIKKIRQKEFIAELLSGFVKGNIEHFIFQITKKDMLLQTLNVFSHQHSIELAVQDCSLIAHARTLNTPHIATFDKDLRKTFMHEFQFLPNKM